VRHARLRQLSYLRLDVIEGRSNLGIVLKRDRKVDLPELQKSVTLYV
jgi:hypothetical protein